MFLPIQQFLGIIPSTEDKKEWIRSITRSREEFELHKRSINALQKINLKHDAYNQSVKSENGISPSLNLWSFLSNIKSIKDQIHKDVERTNCDIEFFQQQKNKNILIDLLTVWAGKNYDIQYKQGMNEIAGLVLYVIAEESLQNPYLMASTSELVESYCVCV